MAPEEIMLDVRDLEPPEPYERATAALDALRPGQYIRMISPRLPRLLYPWLQEHGFSDVTREVKGDLYEIYLWIKEDADTAGFINPQS